MEKTITISIEKYNVLREAFKQAVEIIDSLGNVKGNAADRKALKLPPKETKTEKINKYKLMISTGTRAKKPDYLKKQ
ncbi:hypothetical protein EKM01_09450 [Flavobacterium sp. RSP46]|uniref:hypothetical protein n=1 Tax=Flavobacterium sp. RSP46 TaxID=2497486 RepID=UPI000F88CF3B|nr:hypothetical protein [Flavobacterium sp. RSP46]RTY90659.1 hypothetical protein EKM01_09450 [Flavobacterium sp. RSP46]